MNAATIRHSIATAAAHAAAWVIGLTHEVPQHHLSDEECEGTGRPLGAPLRLFTLCRWWVLGGGPSMPGPMKGTASPVTAA
jgi:hypothetical protein